MNNIIIKSDFRVSQDNRKKSLFNIFLNNNHNNNNNTKHLLYSITKTKFIKNYTILDAGASIMLKSSSIKTYQEFLKEQKIANKTDKLPHKILLKMVYYLSKQLSNVLEDICISCLPKVIVLFLLLINFDECKIASNPV
jgi:hypothetical protein